MKTVKLNQLPFADGPHQYGVTSVTTATTTHGRMTISFQFYSASIRLRDSLLSASGVGPRTARLQQHRKTKPMHAKWTDSVGKGKRLPCSDRCRCVGPSITNATVDNAVARQGTNGMHTPSLLLVWSTKSYRKWLELTRSGQQSTGGREKGLILGRDQPGTRLGFASGRHGAIHSATTRFQEMSSSLALSQCWLCRLENDVCPVLTFRADAVGKEVGRMVKICPLRSRECVIV